METRGGVFIGAVVKAVKLAIVSSFVRDIDFEIET